MVTGDLGACEWFVWDLRRSGLIERGQLDQTVGEFLRRNPRAEAPALAEHLVAQGALTPFQAERVLNGKTQGLVLGPYVLLDAIGAGSMGQVYKASSKNDEALYAVKVLPRRSMWNVRLARRQVRSFGNFTHPAVVPFVDVGTAGGLHYLVWPLAEGATLEGLVRERGRLPANLTALFGVQVARGLTEAHQNNLFHGLVKPSNVLVGADNQARILDFGIGSLLVENEGESLVDTMSTANTLTSGLDCASPESIMEPTNRTPAGDQYSLGCTLYYCLTGRVPFPEGSAVEKMMAHQTKEPVPVREFVPDAPAGLVAVVGRLMAKDPSARYTGCDEVVEALEPFVGDPKLIPGGVPGARPAGLSSGKLPGLGSRSGGKMPGLPPKSSIVVPGPAAGARPAPSGERPVPGRAAVVPGRAAVHAAPADPAADTGEVLRTPLPADAPRKAGARPPAAVPGRAARAAVPVPELEPEAEEIAEGWAEELPEREGRGGGFGPLGLVAVAVVLMVAVYFGATLLMKQ
ncbi:MAG: serine/threonine protein kinase [Isosphaera sp.]|nr:serine/threonine protein kinase [Isosphaera sp.]